MYEQSRKQRKKAEIPHGTTEKDRQKDVMETPIMDRKRECERKQQDEKENASRGRKGRRKSRMKKPKKTVPIEKGKQEDAKGEPRCGTGDQSRTLDRGRPPPAASDRAAEMMD